MPLAKRPQRSLTRRVAGQGALLTSGFAAAQGLSFLRNALIGHWLSPTHFGIAATLTLMLQLLESLSDVGADRLIVQARDGSRPRLMANAHLMLIARGVVTALALHLAAGPLSTFFAIPEARGAFAALGLAPLIKGFLHLDYRRDQRRLDNWPGLMIEIVPQAIALVVTLPMLWAVGGYWAVVWIAVVQSAAAVAVSLAVARRRYHVTADLPTLGRLLAFGWPILLSALPLVAVHSGDRIVIGRLLGMETLASYSVAFMMTMVPGLLAAKVAHALMLPLLASSQAQPHVFRLRYGVLTETAVLAAALYLALFIIAGGAILPLAFGPHYEGLDTVVAVLAIMWAVRMVQTVPGMALIAIGDTRPLLIAGVIRAAALALALGAALGGLGLIGVAAGGVAGEIASLVYVAWRVGQDKAGLNRVFLVRAALLAPAALWALGASRLVPADAGPLTAIAIALLVTVGLLCAAFIVLPGLKTVVQSLRSGVRQPAGGTASA